MKKSNGYIIILVLCVNMWLGALSVLFLQMVGLAKYISVKHMQAYNDDCKFNLLIDLAKRYIHENQKEVILEGTIFTDNITIEGIETFKGKIDIFFAKKKYIAQITIYVNGQEKTIKKIL